MSYFKKPKMVLFDVGGTLFDDAHSNPLDGFSKLRLYADNPEVTDNETLANLWFEFLNDMDLPYTSKIGYGLEIPLTALLNYVIMNSGLHYSIPMAEIEELYDRFNSPRSVFEGVPELLDTLHDLGIRTAVISNNPMSGESLTLALKHWIPTSKFDFVMTSADILYQKPAKALFATAAKRAGLDPADCWYCGDNCIPDVDGPRSCGMTAVHFNRKTSVPFAMCTEGGREEYLAVNNWNSLREHLLGL